MSVAAVGFMLTVLPNAAAFVFHIAVIKYLRKSNLDWKLCKWTGSIIKGKLPWKRWYAKTVVIKTNRVFAIASDADNISSQSGPWHRKSNHGTSGDWPVLGAGIKRTTSHHLPWLILCQMVNGTVQTAEHWILLRNDSAKIVEKFDEKVP